MSLTNIIDSHHGQIQLILGPMFSGKTTELLRRIRRYTIASKRCFVIKYKADTRYDEECAVTHDQVANKAFPCSKLADIPEHMLEGIHVIGIDEGQFFPDISEFTENMANRGLICIVSALDSTFERKPFGRILELVPLAETVHKLSAVCMLCNEEASFSKRIGTEKQVEVIGGADKYMAVCRRCFMKTKQ